MNKPMVTVVIPTIPTRKTALKRAVDSVLAQIHQPIAIEVAIDRNRDGSAVTRNRALAKVKTKWTAFLDDDDYFLPNHISTLIETVSASIECVDVAYSGCRVIDSNSEEIPLQEDWGRFGLPFNADLLEKKSYIPVTSLCHTGLAQDAEFGPPDHDPDSPYDDWGFYLRMLGRRAHFMHVPKVTWVWHHHGRNTSGQSDRW